MRFGSHRVILGLVVGVALASSACQGGTAGDGSEVQVTLSDFAIKLSATTVPEGRIAFSATNEGPSVHELEVFSVPEGADPAGLPVSDNVADTQSQGLQIIDEVEDIAPSTTASLAVSLEPGTYALICNLASHYEQGMHALITVE